MLHLFLSFFFQDQARVVEQPRKSKEEKRKLNAMAVKKHREKTLKDPNFQTKEKKRIENAENE